MTLVDARIEFRDSASLKGREDRYVSALVSAPAVIKSWRSSLFSFEWLTDKGAIRALDDLPIHERDKRLKVEHAIDSGIALERPVLGIGLLDNVEIGAGRDVFLTIAARGIPSIEVHIPKSARQDFAPYLTSENGI